LERFCRHAPLSWEDVAKAADKVNWRLMLFIIYDIDIKSAAYQGDVCGSL
jgi:hypothetical protein